MYRNIVVPTLREQKRQISAAHMSVGLVLFADISPAVPRPFPRTGSPARFGCTRGMYRDQVPWEACRPIDAIRTQNGCCSMHEGVRAAMRRCERRLRAHARGAYSA